MARQVVRAPYRRRWLVLVAVAITLTWLVVRQVGPEATGEPDAVAGGGAEAPQLAVPPPSDLLTRVPGDGKVVALTFDDGPHPDYTPRVLELLSRYQAVATFCMVGAQVRKHPELVRQVVESGMRLCAHTINHDADLRTSAASVIEGEVAGGRFMLEAAAPDGATVEYFRAPAGHWSEQLQLTAAANGMRSLSWTIDSRDWSRPGAEHVVSTVQGAMVPGAIVLLHDGGGRREQTLAALEILLPWLVEQGYTFTTPT